MDKHFDRPRLFFFFFFFLFWLWTNQSLWGGFCNKYQVLQKQNDVHSSKKLPMRTITLPYSKLLNTTCIVVTFLPLSCHRCGIITHVIQTIRQQYMVGIINRLVYEQNMATTMMNVTFKCTWLSCFSLCLYLRKRQNSCGALVLQGHHNHLEFALTIFKAKIGEAKHFTPMC